MVRGASGLSEGQLQPVTEVPGASSARLRHQQPETGRSEPDRAIRDASLDPDLVGEFVRDIVR